MLVLRQGEADKAYLLWKDRLAPLVVGRLSEELQAPRNRLRVTGPDAAIDGRRLSGVDMCFRNTSSLRPSSL